MENKRFDYGYCGSRNYETGIPCMVTDIVLGGNLAVVTADEEQLIIEPWFFTKAKEVEVDFSIWQSLSPASVCALYVALVSNGEDTPARAIEEMILEFESEQVWIG